MKRIIFLPLLVGIVCSNVYVRPAVKQSFNPNELCMMLRWTTAYQLEGMDVGHELVKKHWPENKEAMLRDPQYVLHSPYHVFEDGTCAQYYVYPVIESYIDEVYNFYENNYEREVDEQGEFKRDPNNNNRHIFKRDDEGNLICLESEDRLVENYCYLIANLTNCLSFIRLTGRNDCSVTDEQAISLAAYQRYFIFNISTALVVAPHVGEPGFAFKHTIDRVRSKIGLKIPIELLIAEEHMTMLIANSQEIVRIDAKYREENKGRGLPWFHPHRGLCAYKKDPNWIKNEYKKRIGEMVIHEYVINGLFTDIYFAEYHSILGLDEEARAKLAERINRPNRGQRQQETPYIDVNALEQDADGFDIQDFLQPQQNVETFFRTIEQMEGARILAD